MTSATAPSPNEGEEGEEGEGEGEGGSRSIATDGQCNGGVIGVQVSSTVMPSVAAGEGDQMEVDTVVGLASTGE